MLVQVFTACCAYLAMVGVAGVVFNSAIIILYLTQKKVRHFFNMILCQTQLHLYWSNFQLWTDFNLLLMNLIMSELLVSLYGIPVDFMASLQEGWKMGQVMCQATGFILTTLGNNSVDLS